TTRTRRSCCSAWSAASSRAGCGSHPATRARRRTRRSTSPPSPAEGLLLPVVWSDDCPRHDPGGEVFVGVRPPGTELPVRVEAIRAALLAAGARFVPAQPHDDDA